MKQALKFNTERKQIKLLPLKCKYTFKYNAYTSHGHTFEV